MLYECTVCLLLRFARTQTHSHISFSAQTDEALLEAESLALKNNRGMAFRSFESAALLAGRRGLTQIQALANERFAVYLEEIGNEQDAEYRLKAATTLYREWGATAKVEQLRMKLEKDRNERSALH